MEIIIYDHQIFAVNRNKAEGFSDFLVYKAKDGLHQIDFEECAKNFEDTYSANSHNHRPCRWLALAPLGHFTR